MSQAIYAKSAKARRTIAAFILTHHKTFGRSLDDCFECNDGEEVLRLLWNKAENNTPLRQQMIKLGFKRAAIDGEG